MGSVNTVLLHAASAAQTPIPLIERWLAPAAASYPAVIEEPPILCVEMVSPDDRWADLVVHAGDYLTMGVPVTWILDPGTKQAFLYSDQDTVETSEPVLRHGPIELPVAELFQRI